MNNLTWDGCDVIQLAQKYGTPLYVLSENMIRTKCRIIKKDFLEKYDNTKAVYASKAFLTLAMCKLINSEGLGLDVVSGGELYTAIKSNFPVHMIEFNGNNKSYEELEMAIDYQIGRIIVDNDHELDLIETICKEKNKTIPILFRIVPETETATHDYISTGHKSSKFGVNLEPNIIFNTIQKAVDSPYVDFKGIHFHVGSQLHVNSSHINAIYKTLHLILDIKNRMHISVEELNIGGGFGIKYTEEDDVKPLSYFIDPAIEIIDNYCAKHNLIKPQVIIEPGRWIVGEAGITLYEIGSIKTNGTKKFVSIDGGMSDNIRPSLYQAKYSADIANKIGQTKDDLVSISGKFCESSDILIENLLLPEAESGDILAVYSTGAYTYSMANNYNRQNIPAVVLVDNGNSHIIVKHQTYEDQIRNELIPNHLEDK